MPTRADVMAEAMTWLGTPYHPNARLKGIGVDCAMFPAAVYEAVGLTPHIAPRYSAQWMLHRDEEAYLEWVRPHAREIDRADLGPGDFVIWKFGRTYSHGAIVVDAPQVIHAFVPARCVTLGDMDRDVELAGRAAKHFTLF